MPRRVGSQFTQQRKRYKYDFKNLGSQDLTDGQVWRLDSIALFTLATASIADFEVSTALVSVAIGSS